MVTINMMLDILKAYVEEKTAGFDLPVALQKGDEARTSRAPNVYKGRLPNSKSYEKYAPYIIIQYRTGYERQTPGNYSTSIAAISFICVVHNLNEEEGAAELNNVLDHLKLSLIRDGMIGGLLEVDKSDEGLITYVYTEDTAPYYGGELVAVFNLPSTEREVPQIHGW